MNKLRKKPIRINDAALKQIFEAGKIGQTAMVEIAAELSAGTLKDQKGISYSQFRQMLIKNEAVRKHLDLGFSRGKNQLLALLFKAATEEGDTKVAMWLLERVFGVTPKVEVDHKNSDGSLNPTLTEEQREEMCRAYLEKKTLNK